MRYQIILYILAILVGITGIVSANPDPCPGPDQWNTVNQLSPAGDVLGTFSVVSDGGNPATYSTQGTSPILEVCGASSSSNALDITPSFWNKPPSAIKSNGWPNSWFQFAGESNPIPTGVLTTVGTVQWDTNPNGDEIYILHISDPKCPGGATCFVKTGISEPPIPELNPSILTAIGLIGLVLVVRRYKN